MKTKIARNGRPVRSMAVMKSQVEGAFGEIVKRIRAARQLRRLSC